MDLPLSHEFKRALEYAAEEADALQHKMIDSAHLVLGLMRVEACLAATLLRKHGVEYDSSIGSRLIGDLAGGCGG